MSNYDQQGSYELDYIRLVNYEGKDTDITDMLSTMSLTSDLFSACMFGEIQIIDALDLQQTLPIIGEEKIRIRFRTGDDFEWREHEFSIYGLSDRVPAGPGSYSYSLKFISTEMITNQFTRVSKGFKSKLISEIVRVVFDALETDKDISIEKTQGKINYIAPQWNPFKIINNMTWKAESQTEDGAAYVFYEDQDGFHFKSIESLFTSEPIDYNLVQAKVEQDTETSFFNILSHEFVTQTNELDLINKGMFGGVAQTFDPLTRTIGKIEYNYDKDFQKTRHVEESEIDMKFTSNLNENRARFQQAILKSMLSRARTTSSVKNSTFDNEWHTSENIFLKRMSQLQQMTNNIRLRLIVPGNSEILVGSVLNLKIPSHSVEDVNDSAFREDRFISGRYLLDTLTHTFTKTSMFTIMEVTKDCYKQDHEDAIREELFR